MSQTTHVIKECDTAFPITISAYDSNAIGYLWSTGDTTTSVEVDSSSTLTVETWFADSSFVMDTFKVIAINKPPSLLDLTVTASAGTAIVVAPTFQNSVGIDSLKINVIADSSLSYVIYSDRVVLVFPWGSPGGAPQHYKVNLEMIAINSCGIDSICRGIDWSYTGWPEYLITSCFDDVGLIIGMNETNSSAAFIFPNPTTDALYHSGLDSQSTFQLLDYSGRSLREGKLKESIDVQGIASGTYVLVIRSGAEVFTEQIIKL